jgi:hypothetical protein
MIEILKEAESGKSPFSPSTHSIDTSRRYGTLEVRGRQSRHTSPGALPQYYQSGITRANGSKAEQNRVPGFLPRT